MEFEQLQKLLNDRLSLRQISEKTDRSVSNIRYWMDRYGFYTQASRRLSSVWKIHRTEFVKVVTSADSVTEVLAHFGLKNKGQNFVVLRQRMLEEGLSYQALSSKGTHSRKNKTSKRRTLEEILVVGSDYTNRSCLKKRLIKSGRLDYKCQICGQVPEWKEKQLSLILDHINGVSNDNRLENLRFLCPNCNSQTKTFSGRNIKRKSTGVGQLVGSLTLNQDEGVSSNLTSGDILIRRCPVCSSFFEKKTSSQKFCANKCFRESQRKVKWPSKVKLAKLLEDKTWTAVGKIYGVSDNAVRNWAKRYGII